MISPLQKSPWLMAVSLVLAVSAAAPGAKPAGFYCPGTHGRRWPHLGRAAAGFRRAHSGKYREAGELRNAADALGAGPRCDRGGTRDWRGAGVDQVGVRTLLQRLRRLPGSEDRQLHRTGRRPHSPAHRNHQCLCGLEGDGRGEREAHRAGDRALRFAQQRHSRRQGRRSRRERRRQRNRRQPGMRAGPEQAEVSGDDYFSDGRRRRAGTERQPSLRQDGQRSRAGTSRPC